MAREAAAPSWVAMWADDRFVLGEDHGQPVAVFQREVADAVELGFHRRDQVPHRGVAGDRQDRAVHGFVEREKTDLVADGDAALLLGELAVQGAELGVGGKLGGAGDGVAFQRLADELAVADGGEADRGDVAAGLRDDAEQAVFDQALDDLADGGAADAVLGGEASLRQCLAWAELAGEDFLVQAGIEAVADVARRFVAVDAGGGGGAVAHWCGFPPLGGRVDLYTRYARGGSRGAAGDRRKVQHRGRRGS